ncbi:MAG TPA: substrate-binding domain-containing protein [Phycisphaerae bacterium]|nr:substrate-binding domain-containing protein [Phycisphaerae bacterium]
MSEQSSATVHTPHPSNTSKELGLIIAFGIIAILLAAGVAAWKLGYFQANPRVAIVTWNDDPYWDLVIDGAQAAAKAKNIDLIIVRSQADVKIQTQHVRDLLDKGVQGIAISPNGPADQLAILNEAANKAVLVTFDSDAAIPQRKAFVGSDNYQAGQLAAEQIREAIPDGGDVIISVGSIDMVNGRQRRQGIIDNLLDRRPNEERPADPLDAPLKGTSYSIVATVLDNGDRKKATAGVADAIKAHPDVKCIVALFSYSPAAVVDAIQQTNNAGKIKVVGFDESDATQAGIANGTIYSSILQDQYRCGYAAIDFIADTLRGAEENAPIGVHFIPLRVRVLKSDNLTFLRADKMIHTPKM